MTNLTQKFYTDQAGATAIEYALIAASITLVIIASLSALGGAISGQFTKISSALQP